MSIEDTGDELRTVFNLEAAKKEKLASLNKSKKAEVAEKAFE